MKKLNWGILGLGSIATSFAASFCVEDAQIYAAGSRTLEKAEQFAKEHGIEKAYGSYDELLKDPAIDVVYIATPHSHHADLIMKSLENNKHVLCEKAIVMNTKQLDAAMKLASEKQLVLAEAMTIYHMPLYQELKKRVADGSLGKLKMIQVSFETGVDEQAGIILKNDENEMATIAITFRAKMPKQGIVAFEKGYFTVNDFPRADKATFTHPDGSVEQIQVGDTNQALNYEVRHFNDTVRTKKDTLSLDLTHDVMKIMDTLREKWGLHFDFE